MLFPEAYDSKTYFVFNPFIYLFYLRKKIVFFSTYYLYIQKQVNVKKYLRVITKTLGAFRKKKRNVQYSNAFF